MITKVPSPRLLCLGNFTVDDVYMPDGSFVPDCMGGDALYAALGARLWEPQVQFLAPLSPDTPDSILDAIRTTGFHLESQPVREAPIIRNRVYYDAEGGRRWEILASLEVFHELSPLPEDIPKNFLGAEAFLILAMSLEAQEILVPWLKEHTQGIVALDTQEDYVLGNEERLMSLIPQVDIFLPSAVEVANILGHQDWLAAAQEFAANGPRIIVIKKGKEGALVYDRNTGDWFAQTPAPGKVVDTTGAGDAFCGGFMAEYLKDRTNLHRAAQAGAISASYAVASFGMNALLDAKPENALKRMQEDHSG